MGSKATCAVESLQWLDWNIAQFGQDLEIHDIN